MPNVTKRANRVVAMTKTQSPGKQADKTPAPVKSSFIQRMINKCRAHGWSAIAPSRVEIESATSSKVLLLGREFLYRICTQNLMLKSSSITYSLILSIVPLLAIGFTFFKVFGGLDSLLDNVIIPKIDVYFEENIAQVMKGYMRGFVGNIETGALGATALFTLLLTVISLLGSVESSFNQIVDSKKERSITQRVLNYWLLLTLTPFVALVSTAKSTEFLLQLANFFSFSPAVIKEILNSHGSFFWRFFGAFLLEVVGFAVLYTVLPAKRPSLRAVFAGAVIAATGFESLQWVNAYSSAKFFKEASLVQLYGSVPLLTVILFVWLRLVAIVLLAGLIFAAAIDRIYASGNPKKSKNAPKLQPLSDLASIVQVFAELAAVYIAGGKGISIESLTKQIKLMPVEVERATKWLEEQNLAFHFKSGESKFYFPSHLGLEFFKKPDSFAQHLLNLSAAALSSAQALLTPCTLKSACAGNESSPGNLAAQQDLFAKQVLGLFESKLATAGTTADQPGPFQGREGG